MSDFWHLSCWSVWSKLSHRLQVLTRFPGMLTSQCPVMSSDTNTMFNNNYWYRRFGRMWSSPFEILSHFVIKLLPVAIFDFFVWKMIGPALFARLVHDIVCVPSHRDPKTIKCNMWKKLTYLDNLWVHWNLFLMNLPKFVWSLQKHLFYLTWQCLEGMTLKLNFVENGIMKFQCLWVKQLNTHRIQFPLKIHISAQPPNSQISPQSLECSDKRQKVYLLSNDIYATNLREICGINNVWWRLGITVLNWILCCHYESILTIILGGTLVGLFTLMPDFGEVSYEKTFKDIFYIIWTICMFFFDNNFLYPELQMVRECSKICFDLSISSLLRETIKIKYMDVWMTKA